MHVKVEKSRYWAFFKENWKDVGEQMRETIEEDGKERKGKMLDVDRKVCLRILVEGQCCGAETICFGSSSGFDFQKVSTPAPTEAFWVPVFTAFK